MLKGGDRIGSWRLAASDHDCPGCSLAAAGSSCFPEWRRSLDSLPRLRLESLLSLTSFPLLSGWRPPLLPSCWA